MVAYATRVKSDIARWVETGLIDVGTGRALSADVDATTGSRLSFGAVLAMMAATLFAAAILIFIAANWEAIPRLARVGMLFVLILAGYAGGAVLKLRDRAAYGEAAWVVAATAFGASIALIGQMYHMSGDEAQAVLVWCLATALAAAALRSQALTVGAVLLAGAWMLMAASEDWWNIDLPMGYLPLALALYILSFWTLSRPSRVLLVLSLYLFAFVVHIKTDEALEVPIVLALVSVALFAAARLLPREAGRVLGLGSLLPVLALLGFLTGVGMVQVDLIEEPGFLIPCIAAFVGIIAALLIGGRENRWLRRLAYTAFIFQLGFIYVVMLGSMMDTAGFFVIGGVALSLLALLIARLERRFAPASQQEAAE